MHVTGVVVGGRGKATHRIELLSESLTPLLGATPFPGTLNVVMQMPLEFDLHAVSLATSDGKRAFWPIALAGVPCLAVRFPSCPMHVIEIVSHRHLRSELGLADGSRIEIEAPHAQRVSLPRFLGWAAVWAFRRDFYYTSDTYVAFTKRVPKFRKMGVQRVRA